jgi:hypothetical protein
MKSKTVGSADGRHRKSSPRGTSKSRRKPRSTNMHPKSPGSDLSSSNLPLSGESLPPESVKSVESVETQSPVVQIQPESVETQSPTIPISDIPSVGVIPVQTEAPEVVVQEAAAAPKETSPLPSSNNAEWPPTSVRMAPLGSFHLGGSIRFRLGALFGWSCMAGAGVINLLSRSGPFPATQMSELLATWAGVAGIIWVVSARLSK